LLRLLWTQRQNFGPSPPSNHKIVYDLQRKRTLLFGGGNRDIPELDDTWEWDGDNWTQVAETGPSPRSGYGMTYDTARSRAVLFGGIGQQGGPGLFLGDTWEWDGEAWAQLADFGPPPRQTVGMAYDSVRKRVVMFGGTGSMPKAIVFGDTWEWDGSEWTQVADSGPAPRGLLSGDTENQEPSSLAIFS